jgi:predicted acyltransferase
MKFIPVPGFGAGVISPEGNLSAFIDQHLLPGRFCCYGYGDNEGILSTIPAISTTMLGVLTGHWLKSSFSKNKKVLGIFLAGILSILLGLLWNLNFPINKLIWTSSYVLFAGGLSLLFLALFYWIIEIRGYQTWAFPFVVIGLNPITIYVLSGVFNFGSVVNIFVHGFIDYLGEYKELFWVLCVFAVKWLFLYFLYKRKIFLKA